MPEHTGHVETDAPLSTEGRVTAPNKAVMMKLPNGNFLYPTRLKSINAIRSGRLPNLSVILECLTMEEEIEMERIECENYEEVDAVGYAIKHAIEMYFPDVTLSFSEGEAA